MKTFQRLAVSAAIATYLLIFIGSLVRVSGAGLGCPDWPKCFGAYVPPMTQTDLDARIMQARYAPEPPGWVEKVPPDFTPTLAWIEYLNRLASVVVGFIMLACLVQAWRQRRALPIGLKLMIGILLLTGFQAWLGARVVLSELHPLLISAHLLLAILIVGLLVWLAERATAKLHESEAPDIADREGTERVRRHALALGGLVLVQIIVGALLRGRIEELDKALPLAHHLTLFTNTGPLRYAHIALGLVTALACLGIGWHWWRDKTTAQRPVLQQCGAALAALGLVQVVLGMAFGVAGMAPLLQLFHAWGASLLAGVLILAYAAAGRTRAPAPPEVRSRRLAMALGGIGMMVVVAAITINAAEASRRQITVLGQAPEFQAVDQQEESFTDDDLRGKLTVLNFSFTSCTGVCPRMNSKVLELYDYYQTTDKVQFVSFTVDPEVDKPATLRDYAAGLGVDDQRWRFLHTDMPHVKAIAREGFMVSDDFPDNHSPKLILLDGQARIRGYFDYGDPRSMASLKSQIRTLAEDLD